MGIPAQFEAHFGIDKCGPAFRKSRGQLEAQIARLRAEAEGHHDWAAEAIAELETLRASAKAERAQLEASAQSEASAYAKLARIGTLVSRLPTTCGQPCDGKVLVPVGDIERIRDAFLREP